MTGWLSNYRVIDLTDGKGLLAGQLLAKLGADVIQVEPLEGSSARQMAPLSDNGESYYWSAFAAGKRGVSLDLYSNEGRSQFLKLIADADFLFDSFAPGMMTALGIDYDFLRTLNPKLIHTSITAFGSTGPKADYEDSDLILWAAGGPMHPHRDAAFLDGEGPPLRMSVPQSYLHASADAAVGALVAHTERRKSGQGQHVEISVQRSVTQTVLANLAAAVGDSSFDYIPPSARAVVKKSSLDLSGSGAKTRRSKWYAADGLVETHLGMGPAFGAKTNNLFKWMFEEGELPEKFQDWNWIKVPDQLMSGALTEDDLESARIVVSAFLAKRTKSDLFAAAVQRALALAPIQSVPDMLADPQLASRDFFWKVDENGVAQTIPGPFAFGPADMFDTDLRGAPSLGQHNHEIFSTLPDLASESLTLVSKSARSAPFEGLKVLDLAWAVAGPAVGRTLADYGATVLRVESSVRVEVSRMMGPFPDGVADFERSALYDTNNAGKHGIVLDLGTEEGRSVIWDLIKWADVLVESFAPGQLSRWQMPPEKILDVNPALIGVSTSLMGQTGPYASFAGFGNLGAAIAGFQGLGGHPDMLPIGPFGPYTDFVAPRFALIALLAALEQRSKTGRGCWLDVGQAECGIQFLAPQVSWGAATGQTQAVNANRDNQFAPHGAFSCKGSNWIAIAIRSDREWRAFAELMGGRALHPGYATLSERRSREDELEEMISAWTATWDAFELERVLQGAGIAAHQVACSADLLVDGQLEALGHFVRLPHPKGGLSIFEASRYKLSETPATYLRPAPHFGRDLDTVLESFLSYDQDRIAELRDKNVFR